MKKLSLRIADLAVESFSVLERDPRGGTVHGHMPDTRVGSTCVTQCATGPCDCVFTDPYSCEVVCVS